MRAAIRPNLVENHRGMITNGLFADAIVERDLLVEQPGGDGDEDLALAGGERFVPAADFGQVLIVQDSYLPTLR